MKILLFLTSILAITIYAKPAVTEQIKVYFGTDKGKGIYIALFNTSTGELTKPKLAIEIENPGFIVIHPNKKFMYTTTTGLSNSQDGGVAALKINTDGTLTLINKQSSEGANPCHVSIDKTGSCLMVANYTGGTVASYKINKNGSISEAVSIHHHKGSIANSKRQTEPHPHSIFPNPENTFAYVSDLGTDKIIIYKLEPEKAMLTKINSAIIPGEKMGPRHLKWSEDGKYVYVLNELSPKLTIFESTKVAGKLKYINTLSTLSTEIDATNIYGAEIRIHPNGKFIYTANRDTANQGLDSITTFSTFTDNQQGKRIDITPAEVSIPRNFNIDPSGKWLLAAGKNSHDIAIFSINPEIGKLTFTGNKISFNDSPICIEYL